MDTTCRRCRIRSALLWLVACVHDEGGKAWCYLGQRRPQVPEEHLLVVGVEQCRPKMMPRSLPVHFSGTILEPICQCHVTVCQVDSICPPRFRSHRVLLRKNQTHDLAQLDILEEELDVDWVWSVIGYWVAFVFNEIFFRYHLHVRIICIDRHGTTQSYCHRSIASEQ